MNLTLQCKDTTYFQSFEVFIYLLLFGSVEVFRSCGFAGSPLDGSNMFKHAQTVQFFFCGYKAIPTVKCLIVVA